MVRYLGPYQTVCDDWNYFWTYISDLVSEPTGFGNAQRALINLANSAQPNNVGQQGATAPVDGGGTDSLLTGGNEYLHSQAYGAAIATNGLADCETGQRGFVKKLNYYDPQGRDLATDAHTPGNQGPTFAGRAARAEGRDVQPQPADRTPAPERPGEQLTMKRKGRRGKGLSKFAAGAIGIVVIVAFSYGAYTKFANPFASQYTIHAVFSNANGLQPGLVRPDRRRRRRRGHGRLDRARLPVGDEDPGRCQAADVTMTINSNGLPIHTDATFAIRPRIFLEGNFFVDLSPGTPSAPDAPSGHTFPIQQGVEPVQLDQVLTSLQAGTRQNLQTLLQQYGKAVYNSAARRSIAASSTGCRPTSTRRSSRTTRSASSPTTSRTTSSRRARPRGALNAHPQTLQNLITDFNTTAERVRARERRAPQHGRRAAADAVGGDSGLQRAQRRLPAAREARRGADSGRQVDRPDDRREPAVHHPAAAAGAAVRAAGAGQEPAARRSRRSRS